MSIKRSVSGVASPAQFRGIGLVICAAGCWEGGGILNLQIMRSRKIRFSFAILSLLGLLTLASFAQEVAPTQKSPARIGRGRNLTVDDYFRIKDVKEDKDKKRIWMSSASSGEAIALTHEDANSTHPRWSPDGKYLGFLSER